MILLLSLSSLASCGQDSFDKKVKALYKNTVPLVKVDSLKDNMDKVLLLDAREREEYEVSHLQGALFVGYESFEIEQLSDLPKDQEIVVYCSVGVRSERIGEKLQEAGYSNVRNLYGGIFGWKNSGNEVVGMNEQPTDSVHAYNRLWGMWLYKGKKVY